MPPLGRRGSGGALPRDRVPRLPRRHRDMLGQERHTQRRWSRLFPMVSTFVVLAALFFLVFYQIFKK